MCPLTSEVENTWRLCLKYGLYNLILWLLLLGGLLLLAYFTQEIHIPYEQ